MAKGYPGMTLARKLKTAALTVRRCRNWPEVVLAKMGGRRCQQVEFRDGLVLQVPDVRASWGEIFEPAIADIYGILKAAPDLIVDVGANIGSFACVAARAHPGARITAYEPQPALAAAARQNLEINGVTTVELLERAVSADGRRVSFYLQPNPAASGFHSSAGANATQEMETVSLADAGLAGARSSFIKLDCEGAEGELVRWIAEESPGWTGEVRVVAEYHPWCPVPAGELCRLLEQAGFSARMEKRFGEDYLVARRGAKGAGA